MQWCLHYSKNHYNGTHIPTHVFNLCMGIYCLPLFSCVCTCLKNTYLSFEHRWCKEVEIQHSFYLGFAPLELSVDCINWWHATRCHSKTGHDAGWFLGTPRNVIVEVFVGKKGRWGRTARARCEARATRAGLSAMSMPSWLYPPCLLLEYL